MKQQLQKKQHLHRMSGLHRVETHLNTAYVENDDRKRKLQAANRRSKGGNCSHGAVELMKLFLRDRNASERTPGSKSEVLRARCIEAIVLSVGYVVCFKGNYTGRSNLNV